MHQGDYDDERPYTSEACFGSTPRRESNVSSEKVVPVGFSLACDFGEKIRDDKVERTVAKNLVELGRRGIFDAADITDIKERCAL